MAFTEAPAQFGSGQSLETLLEMTPPFTHFALVPRLKIRGLWLLRDDSLYVSYDATQLVNKGT